jgi:hypothetical protein
MVLHYEDRHARQSVGLEGPDLLGQRRREILANAENITRDSIQDFGDAFQFHIASLSHPGEYHVVDLHRPICDCEDFPRILFCKHIAAVYVHFPHLNPEGKQSTSLLAPGYVQQDSAAPPHHVPGGGESLQSLSQDVFSLSQMLTSRQESAPNPAIIEAFRSAKYSLTTAIASLDGKAALPEKENIAPNQKSWPETAERMGAKKIPRRPCLADERGLTERSIGAVKGKRKRIHNDPYAGGERSGKRAKPDARACAPSPLNTHFPDASPNASSPITCPPGMPPPAFFPPFANGPHH